MDPEHDIPAGARFLSPGGRIWTVRRLTAQRFVMISASPTGDLGIVVDLPALLQMVHIGEPHVAAEVLARPARTRRADPVPTSTSGAPD
jgi:hypothetical protein